MKWLLSIIIYISSFSVQGQEIYSRLYTNEDGLSIPEVTGSAMTYDSLWYIWEGNRSLSLFDGYRFTPVDNPGFHVYLGHGDILHTASASIVEIGTGRLYYKNKRFSEIPDSKNKHHFYKENNKIYALARDSIFLLDENKLKFEFKKKIDSRVLSKIAYKANEFLEGYIPTGDTLIIKYKNKIHVLKNNATLSSLPLPHLPIDSKYSLTENDNSNVYFCYVAHLFTGARLYKSVVANGYLCYMYKDTIIAESIDQFHNYKSSGLQNTTLISTHQGLNRKNSSVLSFTPNNSIIGVALHTIVEDDNGIIYFGDYENGWFKWDNYNLKKLSSQLKDNMLDHKVLPGSKNIDGDILFFSEKIGYFFNMQNGKMSPINIRKNLISGGYMVKKLSDGSVALASQEFGPILGKYKNGNYIIQKELKKNKDFRFPYTLTFEEDKNERLWMMQSGIAMYDKKRDKIKTWHVSDSLKGYFSGMALKMDDKGTMWFASKRHGIKYLNNASSFNLDEKNIFEKTNSISLPNGQSEYLTFVEQVDTFMVFGNKAAISFLSLPSFYRNPMNPVIYQLQYGEDIDGSGSEQNCILFDGKRRLWIGSNGGATMILWDHFEFDQTKNKIKIYSVSNGGESITIPENNQIELPSDKRNLYISFGPDKNPSLLKNIFFEYLILSSKGDTIVYQNFDQRGELDVKYLPVGNYQLYIKARKHGQLMDEKTIKIKVKASLGESPLFWLALISVLLACIIAYLMIRNKQQQEIYKKDMEMIMLTESMNKAKLQGIVATFNPHFIYNSLHWAQSRYSKDEKLATLIGRLSENLRYILTQTTAGNAIHSLSKELYLVENYVKIQQIRFGEGIIYNSPTKEQLSQFPDFDLPIMQLQVHVENAIEHGLVNRPEAKNVSISIDQNNEYYILKVSDDGIGRIEAKNIASQGTGSGVNMLEEMHKIFNTHQNLKIKQVYMDNYLGDHGTEVSIFIPKNFNYGSI